jgi:hypothetical protein
MKNLNSKDFDGLRKLIKQLQVLYKCRKATYQLITSLLMFALIARNLFQTHKSAWPFMEPVDPNEAPDYYKVIKEPMGM